MRKIKRQNKNSKAGAANSNGGKKNAKKGTKRGATDQKAATTKRQKINSTSDGNTEPQKNRIPSKPSKQQPRAAQPSVSAENGTLENIAKPKTKKKASDAAKEGQVDAGYGAITVPIQDRMSLMNRYKVMTVPYGRLIKSIKLATTGISAKFDSSKNNEFSLANVSFMVIN